MKQIYQCFIQTLAPIHIGCDEVYEPMGFVVDETKRELVSFDPISFVSRLTPEEKERFSTICSKGTVESILEIYKFLKGKSAVGKTVQLCSGFVEHYNKTLAIPSGDRKRVQQELNRFQIERTSFLPIDQRPYIPGSSIKGALRTAYLNTMAKRKNVPTQQGKYAAKDLEKTLLDGGAFDTDPFRLVKVSDFRPVGGVGTRIVYAVNEKKKPSKFEARGLYQILEIIEPDAIFQGEIAVDTPQTKECIQTPISLPNLLASCTRFFRKEKKREDDKLKQIQISGVKVLENEDGILIRLGRHSGAESMTIEGHRNIKIMTGRGQRDRYENHATTFWLASEEQKPKIKNNLLPFGWAELGELSKDLIDKFQRKEKNWQEETDAKQKTLQAKQALEREQMLKLERKIAEDAEKLKIEQDRKREDEERKKAALEAMSPEEQDIALIREGQFQENQVVEIYNRIDDFTPDNKILLAQALKEYWIANQKWSEKLSKKQKIKVKKVNTILKEH
jgi:CRISPR-associated protein Csm5